MGLIQLPVGYRVIRGMASAGGRCFSGMDESIESVDETDIFFNFSYKTSCLVTHVF